MKQLLLLIGLVFTNVAFSQEKSNEDVHTFIDEEAQFPGGYSALMKFIHQNLEYYPVDGKLILRFIIEKDGTISEVKVIKAIDGCPECSKSAIKTLKSMPQWTPGKVRGEIVRSYFSLPITYKK